MYKEVNSRWGKCIVLNKDEYVGRSVINYGEYGPDETEKILALAPSGKLCLDIGANLGCISMALEYGGHEVIAFEPQPEIYKLLNANVKGTCYNMGLASTTGIMKMPKVAYSDKGNFGGLGIGEKSIYGQIDVEVRTLDSFNLQNVGFIKIDVEGFETEVLKGGIETITRDKPIMYIEDDRVPKRAELRDMITSLGYKYESHQPTLYREENFFNLKRNIWDRNYASHNLICTYVNN